MKPGHQPSAAVRAQAAAWMARLHGPNRTKEVELGFHRWLADAPEHAVAFELMTEAWERSGRLRRRPNEELALVPRLSRRARISRWAFAAGLAAVLVLVVATFFFDDGVTSAVGEQRVLTLEDGSRVYLNTDTHAVVQFDEDARRVELDRGEALFEVAKRPDWPFIVTAGDKQIRALGTEFVVRRDAGNVAVTLVEGVVAVSDLSSGDAGKALERRSMRADRSAAVAAAGARNSNASGSTEVFMLSPGERLTFIEAGSPTIDHPPLEKVTAWQRGQIALDSTPLAQAAEEMNRYSRIRLVIEDPEAAAIPVSGMFRAGDQEAFARAVARTYGFHVQVSPDEIVLAGSGRSRPADSEAPSP